MTQSSTGLPSATAAALAYSGWWITGGIFWLVERHDPFVRRHAAQAVTVFGLISLLIVTLLAFAVGALTFLPAAFGGLMVAAGVVWVVGVVLWATAMWKAMNGEEWGIGAWVLRCLSTRAPRFGSIRFSPAERP